MMVCRQCGTENRDSARFCMNCGATLGDESQQLENDELPAAVEIEPEPVTSPTDLIPPENESPPSNLAPEPVNAKREENAVPSVPPEKQEPAAAEPVEASTDAEMKDQDDDPAFDIASEWIDLVQNGDSGIHDKAEREMPDTGPLFFPETPPAVMEPLSPGTRLKDRFEIVSLLDETPETLLYEATDLGRCTKCGYGDTVPGDAFCAQCGASLPEPADAPHVHLRSLRMAGEAVIRLEEESNGQIERWFESDGCLYAIMPIPVVEDETANTKKSAFGRGIRHIVGYGSDPGQTRELDEDATLVVTLAPLFESESRPSLGLYAVADGMGGHASGEVASRLAIEKLADTVVKRLMLSELAGEPVLDETPPSMLVDSIKSINTALSQLQQNTGTDLGTTLTVAMVRNDLAIIANVGDSRTYLWRDAELKQITVDHSLVAELVAAGAIAPEDIYTHPEKSAIYRSLGHSPVIDVDLFTQQLKPNDRLVLCCDGVWEMLRNEGIEEVLLLESDPQRACDEIVRRSNLAGGEDNISVIIVQFVSLGE